MEAALSVSAKPSRAQAIRDKVEIRLAVGRDAGALIADLLKANEVELPEADWSSLLPQWLIATVDDDVIGCCQVLVARPVGFVEFFFIHPKAPFKYRAIAVRKLCLQSINTLYQAGCQYVAGYLHLDNKKFGDVLTKMNFGRLSKAELYVKRMR